MAIGEVFEISIPIVLFLVIGLLIFTYLYLRSREKQMLIEKGLTTDAIKAFYESKADPFRLAKIGTIIIFFGVGLGIGLILEDSSGKDYWVPFLLFTMTGLGFVVANMIGRKLSDKSV